MVKVRSNGGEPREVQVRPEKRGMKFTQSRTEHCVSMKG